MAVSVYKINENNSYTLTLTLVDENGDKISPSVVASLILTQYYYNPELGTSDKFHLATINGRYRQNVLNLNNVTLTEDSTNTTVTWYIQPEDTQKLTNKEQELHIALITWKWDTTKKNSSELLFYVREVPYAI